MVWHHVAQCTGALIECTPALDSNCLRHRDLDVIDMLTVPQRLEHAVGEAQRHDVLDCFLTEEMIDPVDLILPEYFQYLGIERSSRGQIMAERLLDHHPAPATISVRHETRHRESVDHSAEETIGDGEVEKIVAGRASGAVQLSQ